MKKIIPFIIALLFGATTASGESTSAKVVEKEFNSPLLKYPRNVMVYTPQYYDRMTQTDFDVIYVFDAQWRNRFDLVTSLMHYFAQNEVDDPRNYIVVGVASPEEEDYNRNNDFLPKPVNVTIPESYIHYGSSPEFKRFIKEELMPWIDSNYRTSGHTLGIGHSLGATFVLDAMVTDELFDDYIALSPNFFWDADRFANNFISYDFTKNGKPRFISMTMANEPDNTDVWGEAWGNAWRKVKAFADTLQTPQGVVVKTSEFPEYDHNQSVLPALTKTLTDYARFRAVAWPPADKTTYPVHIELSGSQLDGDIFITGNQETLADWNPEGIKMNRLDNGSLSIDLMLTLPAEFKFTRGSWEDQIWVTNGEPGNLRISRADKANKTYTTF